MALITSKEMKKEHEEDSKRIYTFSEKLSYSTLKIKRMNGKVGTGFFFIMNVDGINECLLITNKHVLGNKPDESVILNFHIKDKTTNLLFRKDLEFHSHWYFHQTLDLCFTYIEKFIDDFSDKRYEIFFMPVLDRYVWNNDQLIELSAVEDVIMIGYPIGLWDEKNNLPLFKKGITSSHPSDDFQEEGNGVVDIACLPGSSGSPLFIINEHGYHDKKGNFHIGGNRLIFLGVLFAGHTYDEKGHLVKTNIPTELPKKAKELPVVNIGYYIKSKEIFSFKEFIRAHRT